MSKMTVFLVRITITQKLAHEMFIFVTNAKVACLTTEMK